MRTSRLDGATQARRALSVSGAARALGGVSLHLERARAPRTPTEGAKAPQGAPRRAHGLWAGTPRGRPAPPSAPAHAPVGGWWRLSRSRLGATALPFRRFARPAGPAVAGRSEERRVGKECCALCR